MILSFVIVLIIILIFAVGLLLIEHTGNLSGIGGGSDLPMRYTDHKKRGYSEKEIEDIFSTYTKEIRNDETKTAYLDGLQKALTNPSRNPMININDIPDELPYDETAKFIKRGVHIGQRKLFDNEVQFCTEHIGTSPAIVFYAAPSNKGAFLASLFPNICFVLIDPNKFDIHLEDYGLKITRWSEYKESLTSERADVIISKIVANFINNGTSETVANDDRINIINDIMTIDLANAIAKYCVGNVSDPSSRKFGNKIVKRSSAMDRAFEEFCFLGSDDTTDDIAKNLPKTPNCYFISDIRTDAVGDKHPDAIDILWNNAQQYNWLQIMKKSNLFHTAMLKFRHPFYQNTDEEFYAQAREEPMKTDFEIAKKNGIDFIANYATKTLEYYDGTVYLQPFAPVSSTESRLVTDCSSIKSWGTSSSYDNKFFYFNNIIRGFQLFKNPNADRKLGFDYCCDCALENQILERYLQECGKFVSKVTKRPILTVLELVENLSKVTHRPLIRDPHGKLFGHIPAHILVRGGNYDNDD